MAEARVAQAGVTIVTEHVPEAKIAHAGVTIVTRHVAEAQVAQAGVTIVYARPVVYSEGSVFGKDGERDAVPASGDRAAWRVDNYPELHANDLAGEIYHAHLPPAVGAGRIPIDQGAAWENKAVSGDGVLGADGALTVSTVDGVAPLLADGSEPLTAPWDAGAHKITAEQLESDVATGTAPVVVASTTVVPNLNADQVDGYDLDQDVGIGASPTLGGANITGLPNDATTRITSGDSPYTVLVADKVIYCDTDGGVITVNLPAGTEGKDYKIANCGSSANDVTVDGDGAETVRGSATQALADGAVIGLHYNATEGWW